MSSETLIDRPARRVSGAQRSVADSTRPDRDALQPWQLFTLAGLAAATAVVFVSRDTGPAGIILLSLTVGASAWLGLTAWRTLAPLFDFHGPAKPEVLGGRTRAALEREKVLVLRAIRDLEFDRAMGKVAEADFEEMNRRLRLRAATLLRQLDRGAGYRDEIEREIAKRVGPNVSPGSNLTSGGTTAAAKVAAAAAAGSRSCACGTANDPDARFCKGCGAKLEAA